MKNIINKVKEIAPNLSFGEMLVLETGQGEHLVHIFIPMKKTGKTCTLGFLFNEIHLDGFKTKVYDLGPRYFGEEAILIHHQTEINFCNSGTHSYKKTWKHLCEDFTFTDEDRKHLHQCSRCRRSFIILCFVYVNCYADTSSKFLMEKFGLSPTTYKVGGSTIIDNFDCSFVQTNMSQYILGELSEVLNARIMIHMNFCDSCRETYGKETDSL